MSNTDKDIIEKQFKKDCTVINLKQEYHDYDGEEKYLIISKLPKEELVEMYHEQLVKYIPFIYLSEEQGEAIKDFNRNEDKFRKRQINYGDMFSIEDGLMEIFHKELIISDMFDDIANRDEITRIINVFSELSPIQKRRLIKYFFQNKSSRIIAREEGVNYSKVEKSIKSALKKIKKFFKQGVQTVSANPYQ